MPVRKMSGVINNGDGGNNEMSYVDMHDLHPDNVNSVVVNAAAQGTVQGAVLSAIPASFVAMGKDNSKTVAKGFAEGLLDIEHKYAGNLDHKINPRNLKIAGLIVATGAVVMGAVKAYIAKGHAETHNAWSEKVLSRMEASEQAKHTAAITEQRAKDAQSEKSVV